MPPDPPTMGRTYKSYEAPDIRPPIFHEVSATALVLGILMHLPHLSYIKEILCLQSDLLASKHTLSLLRWINVHLINVQKGLDFHLNSLPENMVWHKFLKPISKIYHDSYKQYLTKNILLCPIYNTDLNNVNNKYHY